MDEEPIGCLLSFLRLFGLRPKDRAGAGNGLPYRTRDDFLSPAERSFFGVLCQALGERAVVFAKVRVADLLYVPKGPGSIGHENRIRSKHVDFVLCAPDTLRPVAAIELDDASHGRPDRAERDEFLRQAFAAASLPLVRFAAKRQYEPRAILTELGPYLDEAVLERNIVVEATEAAAPKCPKCGTLMIVKTAGRGSQTGQKFYACPNFPQCRSTVPISG